MKPLSLLSGYLLPCLWGLWALGAVLLVRRGLRDPRQ